MSDEVRDAIETIETRKILVTETDRKFLLALAMVISYFFLLLIPTATGDAEMFKTIAAAISGPIGTIIGYYFGVKK